MEVGTGGEGGAHLQRGGQCVHAGGHGRLPNSPRRDDTLYTPALASVAQDGRPLDCPPRALCFLPESGARMGLRDSGRRRLRCRRWRLICLRKPASTDSFAGRRLLLSSHSLSVPVLILLLVSSARHQHSTMLIHFLRVLTAVVCLTLGVRPVSAAPADDGSLHQLAKRVGPCEDCFTRRSCFFSLPIK